MHSFLLSLQDSFMGVLAGAQAQHMLLCCDKKPEAPALLQIAQLLTFSVKPSSSSVALGLNLLCSSITAMITISSPSTTRWPLCSKNQPGWSLPPGPMIAHASCSAVHGIQLSCYKTRAVLPGAAAAVTDLHPSLEASPCGFPNEVADAIQLLMNETVYRLAEQVVHLWAGNTYCDGPDNRCKHDNGGGTPTVCALLAHYRCV